MWPPAGIALAALLFHGIRIWPGVWLGAMLALTLIAVFVFAGWSRPGIGHALPFFLIPFMAWARCRFDERIVTAAVFAVAIPAIWGTVSNLGPFAYTNLNESLLFLQAFTSTVTLMSPVLCTLTRERARAAAELQRSHDHLELTVRERTADLAANNHQLARDVADKERLALVLERREAQVAQAQAITHTGSGTCGPVALPGPTNCFESTDCSPSSSRSHFEAFFSRVHPWDRQHVQEVIRKALADHQLWERPNGLPGYTRALSLYTVRITSGLKPRFRGA